MMFMDTTTYLPDDILVKVDRAAMGVCWKPVCRCLIIRVQFAWSLPLEMKIKGNEGKWLLRRLLDRHVRSLIERPKVGFGVPIDSWLRGPLKAWAEGCWMLVSSYNKVSLTTLIELKWQEHLLGKRNWSHQLWGVDVSDVVDKQQDNQ